MKEIFPVVYFTPPEADYNLHCFCALFDNQQVSFCSGNCNSIVGTKNRFLLKSRYSRSIDTHIFLVQPQSVPIYYKAALNRLLSPTGK